LRTRNAQQDKLNIVQVTETARANWNNFISCWPDFELLQSYEWGEFKQALGWKVIRLAVERGKQWVAGTQMLIKPLPLGLASIAYIPRGPLLNWEDTAAAQTLLSALHTIARRHRAISLKIEPPLHYSPVASQRLQAFGFRRSPFNNQPQCSMLIDLTPDDDALLTNMHKTTRYNIRYSARQGVVVREAEASDLDTFYQMLQLTAQRSGFPARSREYYFQEWNTLAPGNYLKLYLALHQDQVLATRMSAVFGNHAATLHSGDFNTHNKLKPNELLMWHSLQWAKSRGCTNYDVWGIPDQVGAHLYQGQPLPQEQKGGLWGVYHFKSGFGGDVIYYVGAFDYVYSRPLYWLMNTAMTRLGSLEKLARVEELLNHRSGQPL